MEAKFSNKVKEVISLAREEALRLGHDYIGTEHLMLGMIRDGESSGVELLVKSGVSLDQNSIHFGNGFATAYYPLGTSTLVALTSGNDGV